mgnify:CR=1 FL=1
MSTTYAAGRHFLQIPGPTNVPDRVLRAMDYPTIDHRGPQFAAIGKKCLDGMKTIFKTRSHVVIYPASGTGAWEAALVNVLQEGDLVLMVETGHFATLWHKMATKLGLETEFLATDWRRGVDPQAVEDRLRADTGGKIKAVCVVHNETSTGSTSAIAAVRAAIDAVGHDALYLVDTISSLASIDFRHDEWGVDVAVSGSQKGFMMPTGLAIVGVSQKALDACAGSNLPASYFNFHDMMKMNEQGYFPYTPAATLLRGLRASIDMLTDEGLSNVVARHHRLANGVRAAVAAWGLRNCAVAPKWHSDTVTAILVPDGHNANDVIQAAYHNYGVSLGGGLGKVAGKVFRIGHLGWLNETMVLQALGGTEMALRDAGISFKAGSGVGAAVEYYTESRRPLTLAAE